MAAGGGLFLSVSAFANKGATGIVKERMENFEAASLFEVTALKGDAKATAKAIKQLAGTFKSFHQSYCLN